MTEKARNTGPASTQKTTTPKTAQTPPAPEGFVPTQATAGDPTEADRLQAERDQGLLDQVEASTLEAAPEDQKGPTGGSFVNPAHVGSGTILPGGTYGAPLPDPNVAKLAKLAEDTKDQDNK